MKFLHISDLHLGKTVHAFSMLEDQEYILKVILGIVDEEKPRGILISGDIFDRAVAPAEALRLFDDFLEGLSRREIEVFIISGNHDSADRLAFGARLMKNSGIHISRVYDGQIAPFVLSDEHGEICVYLMPFLKPAQVRRYFPDEDISSWTQSVKTVIDHMDIDEEKRNILLSHQFVTGASTCESEELSVGGSDNIDAEVFIPFDYVALGHLHGAQKIGRDTLRYSGTPLKYSFSEVHHKKSITVVELSEKGKIDIREIPLIPRRDMREIRGKYSEIVSRSFYQNLNTDDYYHITLTDEEDQPDAVSKLRVIYPNLMLLDYDNTRTRTDISVSGIADARRYAPVQLFDSLYEEQNGQPLSDTQRAFLDTLIEQVWEGEK